VNGAHQKPSISVQGEIAPSRASPSCTTYSQYGQLGDARLALAAKRVSIAADASFFGWLVTDALQSSPREFGDDRAGGVIPGGSRVVRFL
jgi:hypothetical protein